MVSSISNQMGGFPRLIFWVASTLRTFYWLACCWCSCTITFDFSKSKQTLQSTQLNRQLPLGQKSQNTSAGCLRILFYFFIFILSCYLKQSYITLLFIFLLQLLLVTPPPIPTPTPPKKSSWSLITFVAYICTCVNTNKYKSNLLRPFWIGGVYMASKLTTLHWTTN